MVPQYCLLAALLLHLVPGDATYIAVAGLFLSMKVIKQSEHCWLVLHYFYSRRLVRCLEFL